MLSAQSQAKKVSIITKLLASCQDFEAKYIVRCLEGKLRIGNAERSVLVALAHAAVLAEKERSILICWDVKSSPADPSIRWQEMEQRETGQQTGRRCQHHQGGIQVRLFYRNFWQKGDRIIVSELPTYDEVIPTLLEFGIDGLREHCKLTPGVPLKPMLAKPTKAIGEVLDRFENKRFTCEYKYDGERAQVNKNRYFMK